MSGPETLATQLAEEHVSEYRLPGSVAFQLAARIKLLALPARMHIMMLSIGAGAKGVPFADLIAALGLCQPTVSHHVTALKKAGLVECVAKRDGRYWKRYVVAQVDRIEELGEDITSLLAKPGDRKR